MAMMLPGAAAAGAGLFGLVASLVRVAVTRAGQVGAAVTIADVLNLDFFRQNAVKLAPGSDASALEDAARLAYRVMGLSNDQVLWPRRRDGNPIAPNYFVMDLNRGRAWMSSKYYSRKSVRSAARPRIARPRGVARYR